MAKIEINFPNKTQIMISFEDGKVEILEEVPTEEPKSQGKAEKPGVLNDQEKELAGLFLQGLPYKEIACQCNLETWQVRVKISYIRKKLKNNPRSSDYESYKDIFKHRNTGYRDKIIPKALRGTTHYKPEDPETPSTNYAYCQNAHCENKSKLPREDMIAYNDLLFCSDTCVEKYIEGNEGEVS